MNGEQLFKKLSIRDYSNTEQDKYAQLLNTIHFHANQNNELKEFYSLLESSDRQDKKLSINGANLEEI